MGGMSPQDKVEALLNGGVCATQDEAAHFLVDCGEINSTEHEELLTEDERNRVYG